MKRILRPLREGAIGQRPKSLRRIKEDVDKLQAEINDVITLALQTKVLLEQLAQGKTDVEVFSRNTDTYYENAGNKKYQQINGYAMPERAFYAGIEGNLL